jgi:hypothetical protein
MLYANAAAVNKTRIGGRLEKTSHLPVLSSVDYSLLIVANGPGWIVCPLLVGCYILVYQ